MSETFIRTVPPRSRGYGAIGLLGGFLATVGLLVVWRETLPEAQRVNLKDYVKASVMAHVKMPSGGVLRLPGRTGTSTSGMSSGSRFTAATGY